MINAYISKPVRGEAQQMYKLLAGVQGETLQYETGTFEALDSKAEVLLLGATRDLAAGKTYIVVLLNRDGSVCYCRAYTVSY